MPVQKLEIALVGLDEKNSQFLRTALRNTMDVWFLADAIDPAIMIRKALIELNAASLHLLGVVENGVFSLNSTPIKPEHFPCFVEDQMRRSVTLWGFNQDSYQIMDDRLIDGIRSRTLMSVFISKFSDETGKYQRFFAPPQQPTQNTLPPPQLPQN